MELGCSTILYGDHSLEVALERIKATGYKAIELCGIPGMAPHLNPGENAGHYESIKSWNPLVPVATSVTGIDS